MDVLIGFYTARDQPMLHRYDDQRSLAMFQPINLRGPKNGPPSMLCYVKVNQEDQEDVLRVKLIA